MTLSVIMPVYNESIDELRTSINSILNQTYKFFTLVIIDDNPRSFIIKKFLKKESSLDKRIKLLFNSRTIGAALSRNKGIKHSHSDLIAIMDADDISRKDRFYSQIRFMNKYKLDFVFSNCIDFGYHCINKKNIFYNFKIINQNLLRYIFSHYYDCAVHSSWMLKRKIYLKLHGYRNLGHGEDFDFIIRSLTFKYRLGYQPSTLVFKRHRKNNVSNSNQLCQFKISLLLKKFARKYDYNHIIPINNIYEAQNNIKKRSVEKFNRFLKLGHIVKYDFTFINLLKFIINIFISLSSMEYLLLLLYKYLCKHKIAKKSFTKEIKDDY